MQQYSVLKATPVKWKAPLATVNRLVIASMVMVSVQRAGSASWWTRSALRKKSIVLVPTNVYKVYVQSYLVNSYFVNFSRLVINFMEKLLRVLLRGLPCIIVQVFHACCVLDVCTGGKEWQDCGTACPLTCDNYDNPPLVCTLQCVQGCFCPDGKADLNGVCVEPASCSCK